MRKKVANGLSPIQQKGDAAQSKSLKLFCAPSSQGGKSQKTNDKEEDRGDVVDIYVDGGEEEKLLNEPRGQDEAEEEEGPLNEQLWQNSDEGPYFLSIKTVLKATNRAGPWTLHESSIWSGP